MLPLTRNTSYTDASPVLPGDLDDIQDCIIGQKHGPRTFALANTDFVYLGGAGAPTYGTDSWITTATAQFKAGLRLPVGTRITDVSFTYRVGTGVGGPTITAYLARRLLSAPLTFQTIASITPDSTDVAPCEVSTLTAIDHVVEVGWQYFLVMAAASTGSSIIGAQVTTDRL